MKIGHSRDTTVLARTMRTKENVGPVCKYLVRFHTSSLGSLTVWDNFQSRDSIGYFNELVYNCYIMHSEHFLLYFLPTFPSVYMLKPRLPQ